MNSPRCIKSPRSSRTSPSPAPLVYLLREEKEHGAQNGCASKYMSVTVKEQEDIMEMECMVENGAAKTGAEAEEEGDEFDDSSYPCTSSSFIPKRFPDDGPEENDSVQNGASDYCNPMDYEDCSNCKERGPPVISKGAPVQRLLQFGRELLQLSEQIKGESVIQKKMMQDAFSLLAYKDPYNSPVSYLLQPEQRESVCAELNSAVLEELGYPARPALEIVMIHAKRLREEMAENGIGSTAFADPDILCGLVRQKRPSSGAEKIETDVKQNELS